MDSPICWQDSSQREGSCLSGAKVRDIKRKLPGLVEPSDHYPLLVIQVGSDGVEGRTPETIKQDFRVLGHLAKGESAQIVLSFLSAWGMNTVKNRKTSLMAKRLVPQLEIWGVLAMEQFTEHKAFWWQIGSTSLRKRKGYEPWAHGADWEGFKLGLKGIEPGPLEMVPLSRAPIQAAWAINMGNWKALCNREATMWSQK